MRHVILISGKDSLATALVQLRSEPDLPYELVTHETGWDLPEVLEWIDRVGVYLGRDIIKCGDDLTEICLEENCLPLPTRRFCTRYAKIKPLNDYLGKSLATIYFGLRADEPKRLGYDAPSYQTPRYPLREQGYRIADVWRLCESVSLMPPLFHWEWMESRVRQVLASDQWLLDARAPWERASLLAWRSRSNCDRCFYARLYEKIGLYEHYPERFEEACRLEERLCHRDEHSWAKGYRLRDLLLRKDDIKEKRARSIAKYLRTRLQRSLFEGDELDDDLAVTSCGLYCGK